MQSFSVNEALNLNDLSWSIFPFSQIKSNLVWCFNYFICILFFRWVLDPLYKARPVSKRSWWRRWKSGRPRHHLEGKVRFHWPSTMSDCVCVRDFFFWYILLFNVNSSIGDSDTHLFTISQIQSLMWRGPKVCFHWALCCTHLYLAIASIFKSMVANIVPILSLMLTLTQWEQALMLNIECVDNYFLFSISIFIEINCNINAYESCLINVCSMYEFTTWKFLHWDKYNCCK